MNNTRYYPYERNRYFYGKLLTVRDFESEQKYVNDKRRLINRLLHGSGVVSGLQVIAVDDKTVSVQMGVALDSLGREIVVASPVTLKLSMMEGFTNNEYNKNVYLCIAYDEKGKEPVHSVAVSTVRSEEVSEYNRVLESYRLFIKEEEPDVSSFDSRNLLESTSLLYKDKQVRIWQTTPRYVNPDEVFEITLRIEKALQTPRISFEYELESEHFSAANGNGASVISFVETGEGQETEFEAKYLLKAGKVTDKSEKISIKKNSAKLSIGDKKIDVETSSANAIEVIYGSVSKKILSDYYDRTLDKSLESTPDQCIHLAKIVLTQMVRTYNIDRIEQVPFGEYVYNTSMLYKLGILDQKKRSDSTHFLTRSTAYTLEPDAKPQLAVQFDEEHSEFSFHLGLPQQKPMSDEIASGVVTIPFDSKLGVNLFAKAEKKYFSDEIDHGLGTGPAFIVVGIEEDGNNQISDIYKSSEAIYLGDQDVFKESPYESDGAKVSLGTVLYPKKGTFRIGVKTLSGNQASKIYVRWWAYKKHRELPSIEATASMEEAAPGKEKEETD